MNVILSMKTRYQITFLNGRIILNSKRTVQGLDIVIESPKDSLRHGPDWIQKMAHDYGYIEGTKGNDGDELDCFVGPNSDSETLFVVEQNNDEGEFDEHKVMIGFSNMAEAKDAYFANYPEEWDHLRNITELDIKDFWDWVKNKNTSVEIENGKIKVNAFREHIEGVVTRISGTFHFFGNWDWGTRNYVGCVTVDGKNIDIKAPNENAFRQAAHRAAKKEVMKDNERENDMEITLKKKNTSNLELIKDKEYRKWAKDQGRDPEHQATIDEFKKTEKYKQMQNSQAIIQNGKLKLD